MKASIVDLRYKMSSILKALDRNEIITIFYRGKKKGILSPFHKERRKKVKDHPFFAMKKDKKKSVAQEMEKLRGVRY